ncbi:hypothetical protein SELMODRAFT_412328 [Selaginella moellendorffii]|uniref:Uncharacterized protein n=1 Tax=Selaginella moellendorffii TaxID=88036 RepID=D8RKT2_SELML|nr:hypothetical protein SELMODRAFT_412328 [Selaginella moellendorffii]
MAAWKLDLFACLFLFLALGLAAPDPTENGEHHLRRHPSDRQAPPLLPDFVGFPGDRDFDCQQCVDCCLAFTCIIRGEHCEQFNGFHCPVLEACNRNCRMECLL